MEFTTNTGRIIKMDTFFDEVDFNVDGYNVNMKVDHVLYFFLRDRGELSEQRTYKVSDFIENFNSIVKVAKNTKGIGSKTIGRMKSFFEFMKSPPQNSVSNQKAGVDLSFFWFETDEINYEPADYTSFTYFESNFNEKIKDAEYKELRSFVGENHISEVAKVILSEHISVESEFAEKINLLDIVYIECFKAKTDVGKQLLLLMDKIAMNFVLSYREWINESKIRLNFCITNEDCDWHASQKLRRGEL